MFHADISRASAELGWVPRIDLEQGLTELFEWIAAHRHEFGALTVA